MGRTVRAVLRGIALTGAAAIVAGCAQITPADSDSPGRWAARARAPTLVREDLYRWRNMVHESGPPPPVPEHEDCGRGD